MQDPLREIFDLVYEARVPGHPMTAEESAVWDTVQNALGSEMIDKLVYSQSRSLAEEQYDCFRAGFRLGVRLILDAR